MLSQDDISRGLEELAIAQGRKVGDERWQKLLKVYWHALRWMSPEAWRQALALSLEKDDRFPTVRKLREYGGGGARAVPRCSYCGQNPASVRDVCGSCAADDPQRAGLEQGDEESASAFLAQVRQAPIRAGEGFLSYLHRTAVGAGLMPAGTPPLLEAVAAPGGPIRPREPGEEG